MLTAAGSPIRHDILGHIDCLDVCTGSHVEDALGAFIQREQVKFTPEEQQMQIVHDIQSITTLSVEG